MTTTEPAAEKVDAPIDAPSRSDNFVRGLSQAIGGPLGRHAVRPPSRFWTVARLIVALTCLALTLHWAEKSDCNTGEWVNLSQYRHACYTDVVALYNSEGLGQGKVPYVDTPVEYPVLTGAFMGLIGLPVHAYVKDHPTDNPYEWYYNLTAVALGVCAVATVLALLMLRRRRPWDAAMFAASPALLLTATVNWDLLAVAFAIGALLAWSRQRPTFAGILIALGASAKLWPAFLLLPLLLLGWRARRLGDAIYATAVAALAWLVVNLPFMLLYWHNWSQFFRLNTTRAIDWGTSWYIGQNVPHVFGPGVGLPGVTVLAQHVTAVDVVSYALFVVACAAIGLLVYKAPRRPRLGQLAFLVVAAFLIFSKVWSQQYVLWLLPLAVLARPRWGAFLAWQAAEVCYFFAFTGELLRASGRPIFPEGVFILAALLRLVTVCVMCGYIVRDVLRPELDVVRRTYEDDPDGGVFDGAPDRDEDVELVSYPTG
ncbi:MAG TPA: glycosyltransferase 87 family protein [Micromonosporaceae bacterium]|nr:glycosyltransferase 87 family protein [Micromonosporaceae bacterium]